MVWSNKNDFHTLWYFEFCIACVFLDSQGFPGFLGFPPHVYLLAPNTSTTGTSGTSSTSFVVLEQEWYKDKVAQLSQFCWGECRGRAQWWGKPFPLAIHFLFITLHTSVLILVSGFFYWGRLWCWLSVMRRNLQKSRCIRIYNFWIGSICILWIEINSKLNPLSRNQSWRTSSSRRQEQI